MLKLVKVSKEAVTSSFEVGSQHLPGATEKHQDSQSADLDLNLPNMK
jgi:hypothetical protein